MIERGEEPPPNGGSQPPSGRSNPEFAMVEPQATRFWHSAIQSGLIDAPALEACWKAISPEKRTPDAADRRLARQTVVLKHLTLWQAQQMLAGRSLGFRIDKYVLLDRIGHGGMGRVYLAKDTRLNRKVALKVLSPERMNNPRALIRFLREAKVGAQLQHENLVRIYDEGECNGVRYLVMEYIEGKNAGQIINQHGPMTPSVAAKLVRQVALGLEHAHRKGLIHRDVNPWNILVTRDGTAKLTDLGLAIDLADSEDAVTRDGATVGTFDYISPEQARHSRNVDTRSDIYSLGCTLFHLLSGRVPFPLPSLPEKLYAHQLTEAESLSTLVPGVPQELDDVVRRMMKKQPEDRYQVPGDVAQALEPFIDGSTVVAGAGKPLKMSSQAANAQTVTQAAPAVEALTPSSAVSSGITPAPGDSQLSPLPEAPTESDFHKLIPDLDFGPELPLSESVSTIKYKPNDEGEIPRAWWAIGALAGVLILAIAAALIARGWGNAGESQVPPAPIARESQKVDREKAPRPERDLVDHASFISVVYGNGDQKAFASGDDYVDLRDAIQSAGSHGAEVVLRNPKPLVLKVSRALTGGNLVIRAAKNERPSLFVELTGEEPFLQSRSDSSLELRGLTIEVVYHGQNGPPPPLIQAAGNLILDRCSISTTGGMRGARAVRVEGLGTSITGCWFAGFDPAVEVVSHAGSRAHLGHCLMVKGDSADPALGWAVGVRYGAGMGARAAKDTPSQRTLEIDHCTISGEGLLAVEGFSSASPLTVDIKDTVVKARALVRWNSDEDSFAKAVQWSGKVNRYDVSGDPWVVLPPKGGSNLLEGVPDGPTSLEDWTKVMPSDRDAKAEEIRFPGEAITGSDRGPKDFTVPEAGLGADPAKVGPRLAPGKP
jgi:eukaryotic-like serine/threonine-protein kinase